MTLQPAYNYRATVTRWVDGDTVDLAVDLGFDITVNTRFRLHGIDTPERGREGYNAATLHNIDHAPPGSTVIIDSYKTSDKYGRWLAIITLPDGTTINDRLLDTALAIPYPATSTAAPGAGPAATVGTHTTRQERP